ncbi:hypothetical protein PAPHI01_1827 [Pancytospora philotis]|nr:hypothetical protein PAPHI01_1827 [Pancytospora philotis]
MRCATKFTCIAQCLAVSLSTLHLIGLLTNDDYAQMAKPDSSTSANDDAARFTLPVFEGQLVGMPHLAEPTSGLSPLELPVQGISYTAASIYSKEWRMQLLEIYQNILRDHVKLAYKEDSFEKRREVNTGSFVAERTEELRRFFLLSERLRRSYEYVRLLLRAYDYEYFEFRDIMLSLRNTAKDIINFAQSCHDKKLERLDAAAFEEMNALRDIIDKRSQAHGGKGAFSCPITTSLFGTAGAPNAIGVGYLYCIKNYRENALKHVLEVVPEKVSREIVNTYKKFGGDSMFKYLHFVYPEMNFEGWGSFWEAARTQVIYQIDVLQRHANEINTALVYYKRYVPMLINEISNAFAHHNNAPFKFMRHAPRLIKKIIAGEIELVAKKMLDNTLDE